MKVEAKHYHRALADRAWV